jgi:hypothetical protein
MRLWSVHPKYHDARGLVALWREALLAQAVLRGRTKGYLHHPQLHRFRARDSPRAVIAQYLRGVHSEAASRGYAFAVRKINRAQTSEVIDVTRGQLLYEWNHLLMKLGTRAPELRRRLRSVERPQPHPLFRVIDGDVEAWENRSRSRTSPTGSRSGRRPVDMSRRG